MEENPYQAPMAPSAPDDTDWFNDAPDDLRYVDGLLRRMPDDTFDGAYNAAWDTLTSNLRPLLGPSLLIMVMSTMSQRIDTVLYEIDTGPAIIFTSFALSLLFVMLDVVVRMQLMAHWLAAIRFQGSASVRGMPTGRQIGQAAILSIPFFITFFLIALSELTPVDSPFELALIAGTLLALAGALLFNLLAFPAMMFVIDQDVSAVDGLKRSARMITSDLGGWIIYLILIPVVLIAGIIALCVGAIASTAVIHGAFAVAYNRVAEPGNAYLKSAPNADSFADEVQNETDSW